MIELEFRTDKAALLAALASAAPIADAKSEIPLLANVLLGGKGDHVSVTATNLNMSVSRDVDADVLLPGKVCVEAKPLHDLVKALPGDRVRLRVVKGAAVEIAAGRVRYELTAFDPKDFPMVPRPAADLAPVPAGILAELIARVLPCVSTDETRYHLYGALLACTAGSAQMVATDGHRLALVTSGGTWPTLQALIPRPALIEMRKRLLLCDTAEIGIEHNHIYLRSGALLLSAKLTEAQFPNHEEVIPKTIARSAIVEHAALVAAVKRALLAASIDRGIRLTLTSGQLSIEVDRKERKAYEAIDAEYNGPPFRWNMNGRYILDHLAVLDADLIWIGTSAGELEPAVFKACRGSGKPSENYVGVVMPMRGLS